MNVPRSIQSAAALLIVAISLNAQPAGVAELKKAFERPPGDARIMMRWWWFGPAVTKPEIEREMRVMKDGGIQGFEVQPVYPLTLDEPAKNLRNLPYLSPDFLDALAFTGQKARELGLRMDLTLGSGWPFGGPHIRVTEAAAKLRIERVPVAAGVSTAPVPKIGDGEKLIAAFASPGDGKRLPANETIRITDVTGGVANLAGDAKAERAVLFFIASRTRQTVKRAAVGAEGFVLNHYDRAAIDTHLKMVGEPMLKALNKTPPYSVFSDSLEVYGADWTGDFLDEFRKRRGYDLMPYLPALAGDIGDKTMGDKTMAIRRDWGKTLTELANDNYLSPLREWAHQHHTLFRSQTYGIPPVKLSSNSLVDLPEGEGPLWRQFSTTRWASSAGHLYNRPVISSETWTWLHSPAFRATPLDMKAEADLHFLQGINQLVGHGWPYSPPEVGEPGWRLYAAAVFNDHNPWWLVMPDITTYLQRMSFVLRQGRPANDVALYLPTDDAWAGFTPGHVSLNQSLAGLIGHNTIPQILDAGYNFDFIDDEAIERNGVPHPVLILPAVQSIPLATYRSLEKYVLGGGILIATGRTPSIAPGLKESETDSAKVSELSRALFEAAGAKGRLVADETQLGAALQSAMAPDVTRPPEVGFVHRKLDFADIYFLANTSNHAVHGSSSFRVKGLTGAWWNPMNGKTSWAGGSTLDLDLAPYESKVLVFSKDRAEKPPTTGGSPLPPVDLSTGWKVTFDGSSDAVTMNALGSWTNSEDRKYFSGRATYERTMTIDPALLTNGRAVYLNFGEGTPVTAGVRPGPGMRAWLEGPVREAAVVYLNGKRAGSVWCPPYEVETTGLLHAGENSIRIVVANLAYNELAMGPLPDYKDLNARYGERFQAQDMTNLQPVPSGLLGPIRLMTR